MGIAEQRATRPDDVITQVCGELAGIFRRTWGRGPLKTTAHWAGRDAMLVVMENGHTPAEKTLRAAGHIQELVGGRQMLQVLIEDELRGAVERATGRSVRTVLSATRLDPDLSAEIFLFKPEGAEPPVDDESLQARAERAHARAEELGEQVQALGAQHEQIVRRARQGGEPDA